MSHRNLSSHSCEIFTGDISAVKAVKISQVMCKDGDCFSYKINFIIMLGSILLSAVSIAALGAAVGFGSGGIVAGSAAAGIQSAIHPIAAGSAFAIMQGLGATGALATTGMFAGGAALVYGAFLVLF